MSRYGVDHPCTYVEGRDNSDLCLEGRHRCAFTERAPTCATVTHLGSCFPCVIGRATDWAQGRAGLSACRARQDAGSLQWPAEFDGSLRTWDELAPYVAEHWGVPLRLLLPGS